MSFYNTENLERFNVDQYYFFLFQFLNSGFKFFILGKVALLVISFDSLGDQDFLSCFPLGSHSANERGEVETLKHQERQKLL